MKRFLIVAAGLALACGVGAETVTVKTGETRVVPAGTRFEGGTLVKEGGGTLDLSGAVLVNAGLEIRAGDVRFAYSGADVPVVARCLRLNVTKTRPSTRKLDYPNSGAQFSEFQLLLGGKPVVYPAGARSLNGGGAEGPLMALDGDVKTKSYRNPFAVDLGRAVAFDSYTWVTANDAIGRDPVTWTLEAGMMDGDRVKWQRISEVADFTAPTNRFTPVGRTFPVVLRDRVPFGYPVTVGNRARLVLAGLTENLENLSGGGCVVLEDTTLDLPKNTAFTGTVSGSGSVVYK